MTHRTTTILSLVLLGLCSGNAGAQTDAPMMAKQQAGQPLSEPIAHNLCQPGGIAVGGYDLISYRQESGPALGSTEFSTEHGELTYLFADDMNRSTFLNDPEQFLPEYGGFCAITLALGRVTCPEYTNFKIEDDRLLLFEVTGFTNGRTLWDSDPGNFREKADNNFTEISN